MLKANNDIYVSQLSEATQRAIREELESILNGLMFDVVEKEEAIQIALNSRLCDLSDLIDIKKCL